MEKLRIGVIGAKYAKYLLGRQLFGRSAELCAVLCPDDSAELFDNANIEVFTDREQFLKCGIDAVIVAASIDGNAAYAARALRSGLDVMSLPMPVSTLDEAYMLEAAVRESRRIYMYAEPNCFTPSIQLARKMVHRGDIGRVLYAESREFSKPVRFVKADRRAYLPSTYSCSGAVGPLLYVTGYKPVRVTGAETPRADYMEKLGTQNGSAGIELLEFAGGAVGRCLHGCLWSDRERELTLHGERGMLIVSGEKLIHHDFSTGRKVSTVYKAAPEPLFGSRIYTNENDSAAALAVACFVALIRGNRMAREYAIDVYSAFDISLPGLMAYRSILDGGRAFTIPDLRRDEWREFCRHNRFTTDPNAPEKYRLPPRKKI